MICWGWRLRSKVVPNTRWRRLLSGCAVSGIHIQETEDFEAGSRHGICFQIDGAEARAARSIWRRFPSRFLNIWRGTLSVWSWKVRRSLAWCAKVIVKAAARERKDDRDDWMGLIAMADEVRPEAKAIIAQLSNSGIERVAILTGDNPRVAQAIARQVGADAVYAELMKPEDRSVPEGN